MFERNFIPKKPFANFKWKWACLQCTEGINDPVVLLGILFRLRKLEGKRLKYSSKEFSDELIALSNDVKDSVGVDLAGRTGNRNIIRNSGQYWRALGLIPAGDRTGIIKLTKFGRRVADHDISQTEFSAITIQTFKLPNDQIQTQIECREWEAHSLILYPLRIILSIILKLKEKGQPYISVEELTRIIIPLSGCHVQIEDYVNFILWYRNKEIDINNWPNCCEASNDFRIAREYLLFLSNYGYLLKKDSEDGGRDAEEYYLNEIIEPEIKKILDTPITDLSLQRVLEEIRSTSIISEVERKRIQSIRINRPNQARFRADVISACQRCIITNVTMPEILEAAHIKPFKYKGEDSVANGFAMRTDIHTLFDTGHLRISVEGDIELSTRARMDYGASIPPHVNIPDFTNKDFLRWRWENYNGI